MKTVFFMLPAPLSLLPLALPLHAEGGASAAELPLLAPPTCNMMPKPDFFCYWPRSNKNHTGTWCTEIAQPRSRSADDCCQLCIKNSSASASAHAGTINCTAFAFNGKRCYLKAAATMNVTGHPIDSTDTSGRLVFKTDDDARHEEQQKLAHAQLRTKLRDQAAAERAAGQLQPGQVTRA